MILITIHPCGNLFKKDSIGTAQSVFIKEVSSFQNSGVVLYINVIIGTPESVSPYWRRGVLISECPSREVPQCVTIHLTEGVIILVVP